MARAQARILRVQAEILRVQAEIALPQEVVLGQNLGLRRHVGVRLGQVWASREEKIWLQRGTRQ